MYVVVWKSLPAYFGSTYNVILQVTPEYLLTDMLCSCRLPLQLFCVKVLFVCLVSLTIQ